MILEKISNKMNPKKNIYTSTWKLKTDKNLGEWGQGVKGRGKEGVEENLREGIVKMEEGYESKERDILIEGAIMGITINLVLEKCPGIYNDDPN